MSRGLYIGLTRGENDMSEVEHTLEEAFEIIEDLNAEAYDAAWDSWSDVTEAEVNGEDDDTIEQLREDASDMQHTEFREAFQVLNEDKQKSVLYWEKNDEDFKQQLEQYW